MGTAPPARTGKVAYPPGGLPLPHLILVAVTWPPQNPPLYARHHTDCGPPPLSPLHFPFHGPCRASHAPCRASLARCCGWLMPRPGRRIHGESSRGERGPGQPSVLPLPGAGQVRPGQPFPGGFLSPHSARAATAQSPYSLRSAWAAPASSSLPHPVHQGRGRAGCFCAPPLRYTGHTGYTHSPPGPAVLPRTTCYTWTAHYHRRRADPLLTTGTIAVGTIAVPAQPSDLLPSRCRNARPPPCFDHPHTQKPGETRLRSPPATSPHLPRNVGQRADDSGPSLPHPPSPFNPPQTPFQGPSAAH